MGRPSAASWFGFNRDEPIRAFPPSITFLPMSSSPAITFATVTCAISIRVAATSRTDSTTCCRSGQASVASHVGRVLRGSGSAASLFGAIRAKIGTLPSVIYCSAPIHRRLRALFDWVGHPLPFDDLVRIVVDLCEIQEDGTAPGSADGDGAVDPVEYGVRVESDVVTEVAHRLFLQRVWNEVCQLPSAQCAALLLNLRDAQERGVLALIPLTDVAPFRQIAEALGMAAEDLTVLWKDLPLDDATIAERLGLERQQVINLRKAARARLARRLRGFSP